MSRACIVAGRRPFILQLLAVLRDWSSLDLLGTCYVVDLDSKIEGDPRIPATKLEGRTVVPCVLQDSVTSEKIDLATLVVISDVAQSRRSVGPTMASELHTAVIGALPMTNVIQTHLMIGSQNDDWAAHGHPFMGWHNLALSPEDAASPEQGAAQLDAAQDDSRWLLYVAGSVCSLMGIWRGQLGSVLDDTPSPAAGVVVPMRAFSRSLYADHVEQELRSQLLDVSRRYPLPNDAGSSAVALEEQSAASIGMAHALFELHPEMMARERVAPAPPKPKPISFGRAMREFFRFLMNALRNAPRRLAERLTRDASAAIARIATSTIYGQDGGFVVVVSGVRPDGSPSSWSDFEVGLDAVVARFNPGAQQGAPPQLPGFWVHYVDGGLTLLDAGSRAVGLEPRRVGTQAAIVTTPSWIAPERDDIFELSPAVAAHLPGWQVAAGDDIQAERLNRRLDALATSQPHQALAVATEKRRLGAWHSRALKTYSGSVGKKLGDEFRKTVDEVEELSRRLEALLAETELPDEIAERQSRLARRLKLFAGGNVLVLVALGALVGFNVIAWLVGAIAALVSTLVWFFGSVVTYMKGQRWLYQFLHRLETAETKLATLQRHRAEAVEDLRRLGRAYRQFLDWTRALGAFVHSPLGSQPESHPGELLVGQGLPRGIRVGHAVVDKDAIDQVCALWRPSLFLSGWLSDCWTEFLADVPDSLGDLKYDVQRDRGILLKDPNHGSGPVLSLWSAAAAQQASHRAPSPTFLARVSDQTGLDIEAKERLLATVEVRDPATGKAEVVGRGAFLSGLDKTYEGFDMVFLDGIFSQRSPNPDLRKIRQTFLNTEYRGMTQATVLLQFGGPAAIDQFSGALYDGDDAPGQDEERNRSVFL